MTEAKKPSKSRYSFSIVSGFRTDLTPTSRHENNTGTSLAFGTKVESNKNRIVVRQVRQVLYWPDRREHDVDNIKDLLDALIGILRKDDGQIEDLLIRKYYEKKEPRVELELFRLIF